MDWTLEVVILPVSDIDRSIAFYRDQVGLPPRPRHPERAHARHPADAHRLRAARSCSATCRRSRRWSRARCKGLQLVVADAEAARAELVGRGVECDEIQVFSPGDGGTFFGFADPDGNTWAVQQIRARAEKPLIPHDHRGRFGEGVDV